MGWCLHLVVLAVLALASAAVAPDRVRAQASLDTIEERVTNGEVAEARTLLSEWIEERFDGASPLERQRALWLQGRLAGSVDEARRSYLRLVIEHPGGPHSADALLRLGQADAAQGRWVSAAGYFEQLLQEYPESPGRLDARRWLDGNRGQVARARAEVPDGADGAQPMPSLQDPPANADDMADAPAAGAVAVQLGAFSTIDRALGLVRRAEEAGIEELRLVRTEGTDFVRVRAGRFPSERAAVPLQDRIESLGFDAVLVEDADGEIEIR